MTTDWQSVIASGLEIPEDANVDDRVCELIEALRSPDPTLRDDQAYVVLANWILRGVVDDMLVDIGERMSSRFADDEIQARTFAPLILVAAVRRDSMQDVLDARLDRRPDRTPGPGDGRSLAFQQRADSPCAVRPG
ncbi:hypothetical protein SAMN05421678_101443 [Actinopolymorpha cephalotaxi]|uniref:Uncharacterized protein n=1 Tax=Actinopolymorpha cephalotaxi TaxID=504797 RepID=A0A1I2KPV7_9ACTN|nr:hypothetical protein [Actinopolymorpha cephalotaxi]NYH84586.1 hypothetical protein [Actinopolymorpha cephalotaxi]SFF68985.1 hypothetical protein SAMN05421678_101443 [Actinopolymorpha cephalotaxi]